MNIDIILNKILVITVEKAK